MPSRTRVMLAATPVSTLTAVDVEEKIPWRIEAQGWDTFHGLIIPTPLAATWMDEGKPWAVFTLEDVAYNVDVSEYIRASGL